MCLIITLSAALLAGALCALLRGRKNLRLSMLTLMYFGAAIMWSVDGFFSLAHGEGFFNMSADDALLGVLVVVCGFAVWSVSYLINVHKTAE